jgi:hypothetical protein
VLEKPSPGSSQILKIVDQIYDHGKQWVGRIADLDGNQGSQPLDNSFFSYDRGQIVIETTGTTALSLRSRYLWGPAVDQILADEVQIKQGKTSDDPTWATAPGTTFWPMTDHLGTVRVTFAV